MDLDFGSSIAVGDPVYLDGGLEAGEAFGVSGLYVSASFGVIDLHAGESVGDVSYELKDLRNNPTTVSAALPYSLGLTFLANSLSTASWPSAYTLLTPYRHFYSTAAGIKLTTIAPTPLVLPAVTATVELFGAGNGFYPVYSKTPTYLQSDAGESISATLALEFLGMGKEYPSGEMLSWFLTTIRNLSVNELGMGAAMSFNLEIQSTRTEMWTGENVTLTLDVYDLVGGLAASGETLSTTLSTVSTLVFSASTGEVAAATPEWHAASYMSVAMAAGEASTYYMSTGGVVLEVEWGTGDALAPVFAVPSRAEFQIANWTGSVFIPLYIQTSIAIGVCAAATGEMLSLAGLDEVSNYKAANGESVTVALEVTQSMTVGAVSGERLTTTLTPAPGGELAVRLYDGSNFVQSSMDVLEAVYFHCNLFTGVWVEVTESTASTSFDLEGAPMWHNTLGWWREANQFEFVDLPPSFVYGTGAGIVVKVDLSTRPRFSISCATGESFTAVSQSRYIEDVAIQFGTMDLPNEYLYVEPHINLCYPNVFPIADNMEVELDFNEDSCYTDALRVGESVSFKMSATFGIQAPLMATGEYFLPNITTYGLWRVTFSHGVSLTTTLGTTASMGLSVRTGEAVQETFEEPSYLFFCGESVEATLQTTFDVAFTEQGCLDNEYVYMTATGDEDKDKFSPAAVELAPFSHDIKARCF